MNKTISKKSILIVEPNYDVIQRFSKELNDNDELITVSKNSELNILLNKINNAVPIQFDVNKENIDKLYRELRNLKIIPNIVMTFNEFYSKQVVDISSYYNAFLPQNKILQLRDKTYMKRQFEKYNIPHANGNVYSSFENFMKTNKTPKFPLIIKPTHGYSSVGVKKISSLSDLEFQFRRIEFLNKLSLSDSKGSIIVEEYIDGNEYAVDSLWTRGKRIATFVHRNQSGNGPNFWDHLYFIDPLYSQKVQSILEDAEEKVATATGVMFGFTHTEYRIHNDVPYVIETSNRPAGTGMLFSTIEKSSGYNMINLFYKYVLNDSKGYPLKVKYNPDKINFWVSPHFKVQGRFKSFSGLDEINKLPYIYSVEVYIKNGEYYYSDNSQTTYPLVIKGEIGSNQMLKCIIKEIEEKVNMNIQ